MERRSEDLEVSETKGHWRKQASGGLTQEDRSNPGPCEGREWVGWTTLGGHRGNRKRSLEGMGKETHEAGIQVTQQN